MHLTIPRVSRQECPELGVWVLVFGLASIRKLYSLDRWMGYIFVPLTPALSLVSVSRSAAVLGSSNVSTPKTRELSGNPYASDCQGAAILRPVGGWGGRELDAVCW